MFAQSGSDRTFADRPVIAGTIMVSGKRTPSLLLPASGEKEDHPWSQIRLLCESVS